MMKSDLDTQDTLPSTTRRGPMHLQVVGPARVTLPSPLSIPASSSSHQHHHHQQSFLRLATTRSTTTSGNSNNSRLTLSAFKRPEHTVRLTKVDPSRCLESDYSLRSEGCGILGHGAFSTVHLARRRRDGRKVAIKSIAKHDALRARRLRRSHRQLDEWEVMDKMKDHPYVVSLLDVLETNDQIHLVTEYCEGGELFDAIQKKRNRSPTVRRGHYSEVQAACITRQLLTALRDLHSLGFVHRDVKPENIVLVSSEDHDTNIHAKLCDFGMARVYDRDGGGSNSDTETPPSTPGRKHSFCAVSCDYYAAPEVCAMGSAQNPSADVYSLGVTLYILLCGFPPVLSDDFTSNNADDDFVLFPGGQWSTVSESAKKFIRMMLHPDPTKRISADNALRNEWIRRNGTPSPPPPPPGRRSTTVTTIRRPQSTLSASNSSLSSSTTMTPASKLSLDGNLTDHVRSRLYQALSRLQEETSRSSYNAATTTTTKTISKTTTNSTTAAAAAAAAAARRRDPSCGSAAKRRGSDVIVSPRRKRRRGSLDCQGRRSSIVCAMKELYCDVASVSAAASAAAAGVVCNDAKNDVHVFERYDEDNNHNEDAAAAAAAIAGVAAHKDPSFKPPTNKYTVTI